MARFATQAPTGVAVQELEKLVRTAVFKSANQVVGYLLQGAADRIDAAYQPKPGQQRKGRVRMMVSCTFGCFPLQRDYYYHEGKRQGHYPADAALGLEGGTTPALGRLACLEGADEASYQKAEEHLRETGGIVMSSRQIQRLVQQVGTAAQQWQQREALKPLPGTKPVPIMYVSADATGVPMRKDPNRRLLSRGRPCRPSSGGALGQQGTSRIQSSAQSLGPTLARQWGEKPH
jgi:hypothetical protein